MGFSIEGRTSGFSQFYRYTDSAHAADGENHPPSLIPGTQARKSGEIDPAARAKAEEILSSSETNFIGENSFEDRMARLVKELAANDGKPQYQADLVSAIIELDQGEFDSWLRPEILQNALDEKRITSQERDKARQGFQNAVDYCAAPGDRLKGLLPPPPPMVGPTPPPPPPPTVDEAKRYIEIRLDQNTGPWGWPNDVSHQELLEITNQFSQLRPEQRNDLLRRLDDGQLKVWAGEGTSDPSGTFWGGLTGEEQQELMNVVVEGADLQQLQRLQHAFADPDYEKPFREAVAKKAPAATKEALIKDLADDVENDPEAARFSAQLIASLQGDPPAVARVLDSLTRAQLEALVHACVKQDTINVGNGFVLVTYDTSLLSPLLETAAAMPASPESAEVKAILFEQAALHLKELAALRDPSTAATTRAAGQAFAVTPEQVEQLTSSLSRILTSDTNGVMRALETGSPSRLGRGISAFTEQMIRQGRNDEIKAIIDKLSRGNDLNEDPSARFKAPDGRNAQVLGYFVGSIQASVRNISKDAEAQAELLKAIFSASGYDAAAAAGGVLIDAVVDVETEGQKKRGDELVESAYPRDPDGQPVEAVNPETVYDTAALRVIQHNT
ncbi:hypothetical protein OOT46_09120 [Aquabacterium sp. A7-Y]|uniref:hypothetical protein n=1 Tax=Aquabacterium sp. A7-Y TaxID=1349605 RepID=UPI00223D1F9F|nr:hypothetical protein [Aquabacterium sp. A7-Y]MCW7538008.1 hypothetical protein [Aquabacterium sp. A7-Y]